MASNPTYSGPDGAAQIGSQGPSNVQADLNARPTAATLAGRGGAATIGMSPMKDYSAQTTVQARMDLLGTFLPEAGYLDSTGNGRFSNALSSMGAYAGLRTQPDGRPFYGFGRLTVPKGKWYSVGGYTYPAALLGLDIVGTNIFSSALISNSSSAKGIALVGYVGVKVADLALINNYNNQKPGVADTSTGIYLDSISGGGLLQIDRLTVEGFHTCIAQANTNVGDGDKTMVSNCNLGGAYSIYNQSANKQAIGWTWLNNGFGSGGPAFVFPGVGETLMINNTGNIESDFLNLPEGTGNGGSFPTAGHYIGQRITVMSQKMEFTQPNNVKLLNASACLRKQAEHTTAAPAGAADIRFRDVAIGNGLFDVDEFSNIIIKVGDRVRGSDNIRLHVEGGSIPGGIEIGSDKTYAQGHDTVAWTFQKMMLAPRPDFVSFLGEGQHPALFWSACENVKLDQIRGGQAGNFSFESRKAFAVPTQGKYLIDTRSAGYRDTLGARIGKRFTIPIPQTNRNANFMGGTGKATVAQLGLSVWMENPTLTENGTATRVQQFADASFSAPLGPAVDVPAGHKGLYFVHQFTNQPNNVVNGEIYVELSKANAGEWSEGVLIFEYFPYLGA